MSGHADIAGFALGALTVQRRRRFSAAEKQRIVEDTYQPGVTLSQVARAHGIAPSLLFRWRRISRGWVLRAARADEVAVPIAEYRQARREIGELRRLLQQQSVENRMLKELMGLAATINVLSTCSPQAGSSLSAQSAVDFERPLSNLFASVGGRR